MTVPPKGGFLSKKQYNLAYHNGEGILEQGTAFALEK
jgi:hypothetical protein